MEKCPKCNTLYIEYDKKTSEIFCLECKHRWKMNLDYDKIKNPILRKSFGKNTKQNILKIKEPKLKTMLRDFINNAMKEYPTIESKLIYQYILSYIVLEHFQIFEEWFKSCFKKEIK